MSNRRVGVQAWRFGDPSRLSPSRRWVTAEGRMGSPPSNSIHHIRAHARRLTCARRSIMLCSVILAFTLWNKSDAGRSLAGQFSGEVMHLFVFKGAPVTGAFGEMRRNPSRRCDSLVVQMKKTLTLCLKVLN